MKHSATGCLKSGGRLCGLSFLCWPWPKVAEDLSARLRLRRLCRAAVEDAVRAAAGGPTG